MRATKKIVMNDVDFDNDHCSCFCQRLHALEDFDLLKLDLSRLSMREIEATR